MPLGMRICRSMTVVRDPSSGEVTIISSMRLSEDGMKELEKIGPITNVVRIAFLHGADDSFYRERYGARILALKGTYYSRGLSSNGSAENSYFTPDEYFDVDGDLPIPDSKVLVMKTSYHREASVLIQREGGILLSGDYFHNNETLEWFNLPGRLFMRATRLFRPYNMGVAWVMQMKPSRSELLKLLEIPFEHVLPLHGHPVIGNAKERYRPVIEKFAKKARN